MERVLGRGAEDRAAQASALFLSASNPEQPFQAARLQMKVSSAGTFDDVEETALLQADAKATGSANCPAW